MECKFLQKIKNYLISFSNICTALVAAPFLKLSATTHKFKPFATLKSRLILPNKNIIISICFAS